MISVGTVVRSSVARLRSGIGFSWLGLVIGTSSSVSTDLMSSSGYCTPTKYWLLLDRVDPEVLLVELDAGVERGDDVLHHVVLGQPQVGRLGAVDVDDVLRVVEPLDDPGVDHAVDRGDLLADRLGDLAGLLQVLARDPDVDRRRLALVHRRADHAAGVEGELQVGEPRVAAPARRGAAATYSWADRLRSALSWTLTTASIGPALGV